jgi:hypothetical protein
MIHAEGSYRCHPGDLYSVVGSCKMPTDQVYESAMSNMHTSYIINLPRLCEEEVINVEQDFCQKPILNVIRRCVDQIRSYISPNGKRKKLA